MENIFLIIIFFIIALCQSVFGVGILLIGTPYLLILDYSIIEALNYLLPLSIFSSLLNSLYIKKKAKEAVINFQEFKYFIFICVPAIFLGTIILKNFVNLINFDLVVSVIIIFSAIFQYRYNNNNNKISNKVKKIINFLMGIIHGISNAGGAILLLFTGIKNDFSQKFRYEISIFYLLLASIQYIIYLIFFEFINFQKTFLLFFILIVISIPIGDKLSSKINISKFKKITTLIALMFSIILIFKNFFSA